MSPLSVAAVFVVAVAAGMLRAVESAGAWRCTAGPVVDSAAVDLQTANAL